MKNGWHEVARLGLFPDGYPHVLVDAHGWCLRLAVNVDRYYSSFPTLLQGLIEQVLRRRLRDAGPLLTVQAMLVEVRAALDQSSIRSLDASARLSAGPDMFSSRGVA